MIIVKHHIQKMEITFGNKKIISSLPHFNDRDLEMDIPADITYNESWTIEHDCFCNDGIQFSKVSQENWHFINRLFSRFYEKSMLDIIADSFDSLHVFESSKSQFAFLTKASFDNPTAPIYSIPQVNFNYYQCEYCFRQFLCRLSEGLPRNPDRDVPEGLAGRLTVHEIVQFDFEGAYDFLSFLKMFRKEVK